MELTLYSEIKSANVNKGVRYIDVLSALLKGEEVYDLLGKNADSFDRVDIFNTLSELMDCDYDSIYLLWVKNNSENFEL